MTQLETQGLAAKNAARVLSVAGTARKNAALEAIAAAIVARQGEILAANAADLEAGKAAGLRPALLDRLALDEGRIAGIVEGVRQVAALPDPIGEVTKMSTRPNGLTIGKRRVPLGVIGIIYEARPNVTVDAAALCLKSGNAVLLRGGKEAFRSNQAFVAVMRDALEGAGLPRDCVALVTDTSRESANELMGLTEYLDVLIPRGGAGLIKNVVEHARVPVIQTGSGVCHIYVDKAANIGMAADIICNAKTSRPSVCNAAECMLIHRDIAAQALPAIAQKLREKHTEIRGDAEVLSILREQAVPATDADWGREYGDTIIAAHIVGSIDEAIDYVYQYSTGHSECIVTDDPAAAEQYLSRVDAAAVYHNASTRFTDGGEFGLGAEIGISTQKLHARGPLGLNELTSMKFKVYGDGQIR